jgi:hypothetical protein
MRSYNMKNTFKVFGIIALLMVIGFSTVSATETAARFLDEYEKFADEYIDLMQRMLAGDVTLLLQVRRLETRAREMERQFDNLSESDFTPAQMQKYREITERITSVVGL